MSCVHYKFSSMRSHYIVKFDGLHITLKELRKQIMDQWHLKHCKLQITNEQYGEEYTDDEAHIPRLFSVIVRRIPLSGIIHAGRMFIVELSETSLEGSSRPSSSVDEYTIPDGLTCPICYELMTDAAIIPCCGSSYCDECIRNVLLDSKKFIYVTCKQLDVSPCSLVANRCLRWAMEKFKCRMPRHVWCFLPRTVNTKRNYQFSVVGHPPPTRPPHSLGQSRYHHSYRGGGGGGRYWERSFRSGAHPYSRQHAAQPPPPVAPVFPAPSLYLPPLQPYPPPYTTGPILVPPPAIRYQPQRVPPPQYTCHRCEVAGHYLRQCPMLMDNISKGIPRSMMMKAYPWTKGVMITMRGEYAIPPINAEAYAEQGMEHLPFVPLDK